MKQKLSPGMIRDSRASMKEARSSTNQILESTRSTKKITKEAA